MELNSYRSPLSSIHPVLCNAGLTVTLIRFHQIALSGRKEGLRRLSECSPIKDVALGIAQYHVSVIDVIFVMNLAFGVPR